MTDRTLTDALVQLQRRYLTASHLFAEKNVIPDGCPSQTAIWWKAAYSEDVRRAPRVIEGSQIRRL